MSLPLGEVAADAANTGPTRVTAARGTERALELLAVSGLLVLAVLVRFIDLPTRGMWDSDQGHDMLVLARFVQGGAIPLLGPPTSIGAFHHGAAYYYLLAPAALLSGADPIGVVAAIALAGVGAVVVVWWLARSIAGPLAGIVAGLLVAVSASAIGESTFIWNPNLLALSSAVTFAAAWRAYASGRARWWLVTAVGLAVTMQSHVLGAALFVPLVALFLADVRRRSSRSERIAVIEAGLAGLLIIVLTYVPLIAYELGHDFAETRAVIGFLTGTGGVGPSGIDADAGGAPSLPLRLVVIGLRVLSWPLTGLITSAPLPGLIVAAGVVGVFAWRIRRGLESERAAMAWFAGTLAWSVVALAIVSPGLATVVPGLPNDHYHGYLDPIVFVVAGAGLAALARVHRIGTVLAAAGLTAIVGFNVATWPPLVASDGGWPAAGAAAERVIADTGGHAIVLAGLPEFKPTDTLAYPLDHLGSPPSTETLATAGDQTDAAAPIALVLVCDRLFETVIGARCAGPAEDALLSSTASTANWRLADRFDASNRTSISVYVPFPER